MAAEDRELMLQLLTATQVTDANLYNSVKQENPLLAKLMMDKLKLFLDNDYFATVERQTVLMKFLQEHTDNETINDVLTFLDNSELKQDYSAIIMEWTYHNSENIVEQTLAKYDGSLLSKSKLTELPQFKPQNTGTNDFVQAILQITNHLIDGDDGDDGDDLIS